MTPLDDDGLSVAGYAQALDEFDDKFRFWAGVVLRESRREAEDQIQTRLGRIAQLLGIARVLGGYDQLHLHFVADRQTAAERLHLLDHGLDVAGQIVKRFLDVRVLDHCQR
jgi:hypothetical protein